MPAITDTFHISNICLTDMMGREVRVPEQPKRIISIVPSLTELLFDLGLGDRVVGITKFCIHPKTGVKSKVKIGGTKNFNFARIQALNPDLIIGNKEENYPAGIEQLAEMYPVWMSDIITIADALEMIKQVGKLTGAAVKAEELIVAIQQSITNLAPVAPLKAAYFIWNKPYMVAGANTFITDVLNRWGLVNIFESAAGRYPEVNTDDLQHANPELVLLSSEPFPFTERHAAELRQILPNAKILIVDGELFSWYGSRLLKTADYLNKLGSELRASQR